MPIIDERKIIPAHQFGFRKRHSTAEQVHKITNLIENCFELRMICSVTLLDLAQAFDKVWLARLVLKIYKLLPVNYFLLLNSYLHGNLLKIYVHSCISATGIMFRPSPISYLHV